MKRFTNPTLAHADLTSACAFIERDLDRLNSAIADMQRVSEPISDQHRAFLKRQARRLTDAIAKLETEDAAA